MSSSGEAQSQSCLPRSTGTPLLHGVAGSKSILEQSQSSARRYTTTQLRLCMMEAVVVSSSGEAQSPSHLLRSTGTQLDREAEVSMSVEAPSQSSTANCIPTKL